MKHRGGDKEKGGRDKDGKNADADDMERLVNKFAKKSKKRKSSMNGVGDDDGDGDGGGSPRYRMMNPTINRGGMNNNGNTKQRITTCVRL
jgi:hypothetical protein